MKIESIKDKDETLGICVKLSDAECCRISNALHDIIKVFNDRQLTIGEVQILMQELKGIVHERTKRALTEVETEEVKQEKVEIKIKDESKGDVVGEAA